MRAQLILALLALVVGVPDAWARQITPPAVLTFHGRVVDPATAPIPGAKVTAGSDDTGTLRTATTDRAGAFVLALSPGRYTVSVVAPGFAVTSWTLATADWGGALRQFVLPVAGIEDTVTVTAVAGYQAPTTASVNKTSTALIDVPATVSVITGALIEDQLMGSLADAVRYVPGAQPHQGENNRDEIILRGTDSSANFFLDGMRDDVEYYRDLYNIDRVEVLQGPNALTFGRGSGGGVINRVTKDADFERRREVFFDAGSFGAGRVSADIDQVLRPNLAIRVNGVFEGADSFRAQVGLRRAGISPALSFEPSAQTRVTVSYEHFTDTRTADRGVPSFGGQPVNVAPSTFFGDPAQSHVWAGVDLTTAMAQHQIGRLTIRDRLAVGAYNRGYQNFVPGTVSADGSATLTAYNNATRRLNLFNQTDFIYVRTTGGVTHTVLAGLEAGREASDNVRNTGFFNDSATSIQVPLTAPTVSLPVTFRPSATDPDNQVIARLGAAYVQDQIAITPFLQILGGIRFDDFDLTFDDHRSATQLARTDRLWSPRAGVVVKPAADVSVYGSYAVSYLPSAGDQFASLTTVTDQLKPEAFTNSEVGAKWDPHYDLSFTAALYRLDRTNTRAVDPTDPTRIVQTGSQRTTGVELGLNGRINQKWMVAGGYAFEQATVTAATAAAALGATVGQVPRHTISLWNRFDPTDAVGFGVGLVYRSAMFATIDDAVTLPGYVTLDAACFVLVTPRARLQLNVLNLLNRRYFLNADSDTNISPGAPRELRVALAVGF
jgi:catecholate siderophore receptor